MKKTDFWFLSLVALFMLGAVGKWNLWLCIAVICNAVVVLADIILQIFKSTGKGRYGNGG